MQVLTYWLVIAGAFILKLCNARKAERRFAPHLVSGACLAASLFVSSCATPYELLDHHYGYSERRVTNDVYEVTFLGNGNSSYERVLDFAMLRAAEIALSHHAKSFALLDAVNLGSAQAYLSPSYYYRTASPYLMTRGQTMPPAATLIDGTSRSYLVMEPAEQRVYYRPGVKLTVKLLPDPPGRHYPYDPAQVSERLRRKYGIQPGKR